MADIDAAALGVGAGRLLLSASWIQVFLTVVGVSVVEMRGIWVYIETKAPGDSYRKVGGVRWGSVRGCVGRGAEMQAAGMGMGGCCCHLGISSFFCFSIFYVFITKLETRTRNMKLKGNLYHT